MNKIYLLSIVFLASFVQIKGSQSISDALTYSPTISSKTWSIVGGTSFVVATATLWALHSLTSDNNHKKRNKGALHDACAVVFSPFKAILSFMGVKTKSIEYPSGQSYFNFAIASLLAYLAGKYAFSFTPEGEFAAAQDLLNEVLSNRTYQDLTSGTKNILDNIECAFIDEDHPHVEARNFFKTIKGMLSDAYTKLAGAGSIQDPIAKGFIPDLESIARANTSISKEAILSIVKNPNWANQLKSYLAAFAHAEKMRLEQEKLYYLRRSTWAQEDAAHASQHIAWNTSFRYY